MLNSIRVTKIDQAINELLTYLPDYEPTRMEDVGELFFDWRGLYVRYRSEDKFVLVFDSEDPKHTTKHGAKVQIRLALNKMWGGSTDDVIKFSIFNHGYSVETQTDVFQGDEVVHEIRVGHLISDNGYRA